MCSSVNEFDGPTIDFIDFIYTFPPLEASIGNDRCSSCHGCVSRLVYLAGNVEIVSAGGIQTYQKGP